MKLKTVTPLIALALIWAASCKKNTNTTDPNIRYVSLNKTINVYANGTTSDSLDLNGDGLAEVGIAFSNLGGDTGYVEMFSYTQSSGIALQSISPIPYIAEFSKGNTPPSSASAYSSSAFITARFGGYREGLQSGDTYIAFIFNTGTTPNYGWMHVSVNSSLTAFQIIDYAYYTVPGTICQVGAQ
jgi:hypothetical protein